MTELEMRTVVWNVVRKRLPHSTVKDWQMRVDSIVRDINALRDAKAWFLSRWALKKCIKQYEVEVIERWQYMRFNNLDIIRLMSLT